MAQQPLHGADVGAVAGGQDLGGEGVPQRVAGGLHAGGAQQPAEPAGDGLGGQVPAGPELGFDQRADMGAGGEVAAEEVGQHRRQRDGAGLAGLPVDLEVAAGPQVHVLDGGAGDLAGAEPGAVGEHHHAEVAPVEAGQLQEVPDGGGVQVAGHAGGDLGQQRRIPAGWTPPGGGR